MTYDEIREELNRCGGVLTIDMGKLRDAHRARKLGVLVREGISKELRSRGINHMELPSYQEDTVRIWLMGSPAGDLIEAVLRASPDSDQRIRDAVQSDAAETLAKIRELVSD